MTDPAAEMKAFLRDLGQPVKDDARTTLVPPPKGSHASVVVLERVRQDITPPYCIHGYAECVACRQPVWLGHESEKVVVSGEAYPICMECAASDIDTRSNRPTRRLNDHLRKDGPHE